MKLKLLCFFLKRVYINTTVMLFSYCETVEEVSFVKTDQPSPEGSKMSITDDVYI